MHAVMTGAAEAEAPRDRPPPSPAPRRLPEFHRRGRQAAALALLVGTLLRLAQFAVNRSLWLDEALVASSLLGRDAAGLFRPLDYGQTAPTGFLLLVKGAVALLGTGELALRLVPLLFGLAGVALVLPVARRYLSRGAAPLAVALFALAPYLIYYSSELKQYAGDALVSLAVLGLAPALARPTVSPRAAAAALLAGVAGVWLSQPAVFMLGGVGLVLAARALRRRDWRGAALLAGLGTTWAASFAGAYAVARRTLADPAYMQAFWRTGFPPRHPGTPGEWLWAPRAFARAFREPLGIMGQDDGAMSYLAAALALACFALGCVAMARCRRLRLALLLAPLALTLAASALRVYPFGADYVTAGRVLIFLLPTFAFLVAEGAHWASHRLTRGAGVAYAALAAVLLFPAGAYAVRSVPHLRAEVKPLLEFASEERKPGDVMYVYYTGQAVFRYYAPRYGWRPGETVYGACSKLDPARYLEDVQRLRGLPRVWLLFVGGAAGGYDERRLVLDYLDTVGRRLDARVAVGASLYLYDLRRSQGTGARFRRRIPRFRYDASIDCRGPWGPR